MLSANSHPSIPPAVQSLPPSCSALLPAHVSGFASVLLFDWLLESNLEPCLVYEYGFLFAQNELETEGIASFNHEFLQSMGIGIAKHRLKILKLAKRERGKSTPYVQRLGSPLKKTKRRVRRFVHGFLRPPPPAEPTLYVSASKVFCRGNRSCRRLGGSLAIKNGEALVLGRGDAKKKKSPLRLKAEPEDFRGCTQHNERVSPVNSVVHTSQILVFEHICEFVYGKYFWVSLLSIKLSGNMRADRYDALNWRFERWAVFD